MSIARNIEYLTRLPKISQRVSDGGSPMATGSQLAEQPITASNPGALRMFAYVPPVLSHRPALVVALHGCAQGAAAYDNGSGWSQLADEYGFVLLLPQQRRSNNANLCFNWFAPADVAAEGGELQSIHQMIEQVVRERKIDRRRIFVTGLSAGGSMAAALLARYPQVFSAGAIVAGLPFGAANNLQDALNAMYRGSSIAADELTRRLRAASSHTARWPRISIWHGSADTTVHPANADHMLAQWLNVHGLTTTPMFTDVVDGHPRYGWWDKDGETVVETFAIRDMGHGIPLASKSGERRYGQPGPYMLEAGIASSWQIANFFGVVRAPIQKTAVPQAKRKSGARGFLERTLERVVAK